MYPLVIIVLLNFILSCMAHANDDLNSGPGLFSGASGEFSLIELVATEKDKNNESKKTDNLNKGRTDIIEANNRTVHEFDMFKEWKESKKNNTESYQEFILWLEYKKFISND